MSIIRVRSPFCVNMTFSQFWKCVLFLVFILEYGNCVKAAKAKLIVNTTELSNHKITTNHISQMLKNGSYLRICHRSDPQLNKCMKESFERLRPFLVKGIPELHIPSFEPLIIPEITMNQGKGSMNLQATYRNLHMWGVSQFELKDFRANFEKDQLHFHIMFPNLVTKALYEINGQILMLPIHGNGIKEGNYTNVEGNVLIQGSRFRLNDTTYFHVNNVLIDLDVGHVSIRFNNLFNGDQELGDALNAAINDNWRHVLKDMKPVLEQTIGEVVKGLFNAVYNKFPLEEILPF